MTHTFVTYVLDAEADRERRCAAGEFPNPTVSTTIDAGSDVKVTYEAATQRLVLVGQHVDLTVQCVASVSVQRFR